MEFSPVDVQLLFPGVTEARYFPYLSLPMLTSFLSNHGILTRQVDINITAAYALLKSSYLDAALRRPGIGSVDKLLLQFVRKNRHKIAAAVLDKADTDLPHSVAFRVFSNVIALAASDSILTHPANTLKEAIASALGPPDEYDVLARAHDEVVAGILEQPPAGIFGISVAFFSQLSSAFRVAHQIKRRYPDAQVVLGGQQITMRAAQLAKIKGAFDAVDAMVTGQGEQVLLDMATKVAKGRSVAEIPSVISIDGIMPGERPKHAINDNPPPDFTGLPLHRYLADMTQLPLITCVGCYWGRCTYCSYGNRGRHRNHQQLTVQQLTTHIEKVLDSNQGSFIAFVDENCNLRLIMQAVEAARRNGYNFIYSTRNRLEPLLADDEFVHRLATTGCRLMSVGYETNSQRLLDAVDKGVDASMYSAIITKLHRHGIVLRLSLMGGLPGETEEEAKASRDFLVEHSEYIGIDAAQMMVAEPTSLLAAGESTVVAGLQVLKDTETLANNDGFSYLGGRHGLPLAYDGASYHERQQWLRETIKAVHPGKNDEQHPRWKSPRHPEHRSDLTLHPWVVEDGPGTFVDLRWEMRYTVGPPHVTIEHTHDARQLIAHTPRGRQLLALLKEADIG